MTMALLTECRTDPLWHRSADRCGVWRRVMIHRQN